jgi:hypothetical protein
MCIHLMGPTLHVLKKVKIVVPLFYVNEKMCARCTVHNLYRYP